MSQFIVYLAWAFIGFMGLAIVVLLLAWVAPLFYVLARPIIKIFKKEKEKD